jgi:hypothetical protein
VEQAQGLVARQEVFAAEAAAVAGPKGKHQTARTHHHWGRTATDGSTVTTTHVSVLKPDETTLVALNRPGFPGGSVT